MLILKNAFFVMMGLFFSAGIALAEESMPHAEEAAHQGGGLPQFDPTSWPSQIFWLVVFFVILYTIFSKSVLPSIGTTLGNRKAHIDRHIAEAETLSKEAEIIDSELKAALR
nr:hypothetical protein [Alphaproteobacteria bacterium]